MPKDTIAESRDRERRAVALHMAGLKFDDIAEQVGFASRAGAYQSVMRAIKREVSTNVEEIRASELARLDELMLAVYPKARKGDVLAVDRMLKLMDRRSKYLGLDFTDGIAERQTVLAEEQGALVAEALRKILDGLELNEEQKAKAPELVRTHLRAVS